MLSEYNFIIPESTDKNQASCVHVVYMFQCARVCVCVCLDALSSAFERSRFE